MKQPLMWNYPDRTDLRNHDTTFMWGNDVLITPVLEAKTTEIDIILPNCWYEQKSNKIFSGEMKYSLAADEIGIWIRCGAIIPTQPLKEGQQTTVEQRENGVELEIYLDSDGKASGNMYWDDGDSIEPEKDTKNHRVYEFTFENGILEIVNSQGEYQTGLVFSKISVHDGDSDKEYGCQIKADDIDDRYQIDFNDDNKVDCAPEGFRRLGRSLEDI